jgi:hypothetical protein
MENLKSRYIAMRNANNLNGSFFYDYAIHKGFSGSYDEFITGWYNSAIDINILFSNLDLEFELTILVDKSGNFLKIVK